MPRTQAPRRLEKGALAMLASALAHLRLATHSGQLAALAALIEQVGPEP